jgi:molybdate transport system substrate-binding protein
VKPREAIRPVRRPLRRISALAIVVALLAAVGNAAVAARSSASTAKAKLSGSITVSAAASLTEAFTKLGADFQKQHAGTTVTFNFAASSALVTQIQGGAPADVFASADGSNMQKLVTDGQVTAGPTVFAANLLTIVVKPGNPKNVKSLADLAKLDTVSLCALTVPCGKYADQVLTQAGVTIPETKVTRGADVKTTVNAVSTGDADAAIVYLTDAKSAGGTLATVKIPGWQNAYAIYPIAPLSNTENPALTSAWVRYLVSRAGQRTLQSFGFLPPPPQ